MSLHAWAIFAGFWVLFVTTPGPNAVNCIANGMTHGLGRALWGVLGILTQAALFLTLSAVGITALIAASPTAFAWAKLAGALVLVWLGVRTFRNAAVAVTPGAASGGSIYGRAFLIATVNAKSVAGYLAAFSQFVEPGVPIGQQMWVIVPTALCLTTLSYTGYTALGAWLGRLALGAIMHVRLRQGVALCFILYGALLGLLALP
ncbi:LysE family translocator [Rhodovulum adriaticum]|uniref:Threonine/homoserine/homoserine lactone efflux protein n=1 Tax=Rhodovulum adriaticum TaxID=35804 RepID=A0A4R2P028_RHOAD|nr:LysE family translocator [Rhodovulum adriaticum]MBK1634276.1 lysine transporter LysE [Rhodovulum adriaticum]TCP27171.1 threonine/homoserine/homoserine lactone efflux protein [Rhodovulum adriaticum]